MTTVSVIPTMRYKNAPAAIEFLVSAFGFKEHLLVADDEGGIAHAQLLCPIGNGMIMLGTARNDEWSRFVQPPGKGKLNTHGIYMIVKNVDAHCEQARLAGAEIIEEPVDREYGGRGYGCTDIEGHVWSFGDYDPLA